LGKFAESRANRAAYSMGLGPDIVAKKIKLFFGNDNQRVLQLDLLRKSMTPKLKKYCWKLMEYAHPCAR
jgi:hypothetical protein